jgi:hypothetical protein
MFYLSPWEFVQWFKPQRLRPPSAFYDWSQWTVEGKAKIEENPGRKVRLEPFNDFVLNEDKLATVLYVFTFPKAKEIFVTKAPAKYERFRHTWLLIRRLRPVIPCAEQTPLPSKRMSKFTRAKIFSVYLRPWTLSTRYAGIDVPHLVDLHQPIARTEDVRIDDAELQQADVAHSLRRTWKGYVASVLPHAKRQVQNFMLACVAEGRTNDDEEEDGQKRATTLSCKLSIDDIKEILNAQRIEETTSSRSAQEPSKKNNAQETNVNIRMRKTALLACQLADHSMRASTSTASIGDSLLRHCRRKAPTERKEEASIGETQNTSVSVTSHNWKQAYVEWHAKTFDTAANEGIVPNIKQTQVLQTIHDRSVAEHCEEESNVFEPLLRMVHGLPGSGKTRLLIWLRAYFQDVWQWIEGREFSFIAPLNSMASNIGGSTVHSWGRISFKDKRGVRIVPNESKEGADPMNMKCAALRFLFVDEVEASGAETIGQLENNVQFNISSKNKFKYDAQKRLRPFGGVNTIFLGDWWQLRPTGQVAIMSNPFAQKALENARASETMGMFWYAGLPFSLQPWVDTARMIHLDVNERSGAVPTPPCLYFTGLYSVDSVGIAGVSVSRYLAEKQCF